MSARQTHIADQLGAAHRDALGVLARTAATGGYEATLAEPSPWLRCLVVDALHAPPRARRMCRHVARGGPQVVFLAVHAKRLECARCAAASHSRTRGTREDRTCDRCRRLIAPGEVEVLACVVGCVIVSAGHCRACRPIVRGAEVPAS